MATKSPQKRNREYKEPKEIEANAATSNLLYRTVEIFRGITGKDITLTDCSPLKVGKVSGTHISLPFDSPSAYETLEHELAHIVFGTDSDRLWALAEELQTEETPSNIVFMLINAIEDCRVDSLWASVYEGSGKRIRSQNVETLHSRTGDMSTFGLILRMSAGLPVANYPADLIDAVGRALSIVLLRGPIATEIAVRDLWGNEAFQKNVPCSYGVAPPVPDAYTPDGTKPAHDVFGNPPVPFILSDGGFTSGDAEKALEESAADMARQVRNLTQTLSDTSSLGRTPPVGPRIVVQRVAEQSLPLSDREESLAKRIALRAEKIMGRSGTTLDSMGTILDVPSCIDRLAGHQALDVFRRVVPVRSLHCMFLIDCSPSMAATWRRTESACRVLQKGLASARLDMIIWGYSSTRKGEVVITDIGTGGRIPDAKSRGETPTHLAIREATRKMSGFSDRRHVILITDGIPLYSDDGGTYTVYRLKRDVRREVFTLRKRGIGLTVFIVSDPTEHMMEDEDLTLQFGSSWTRLASPSELDGQLISVITKLAIQRRV